MILPESPQSVVFGLLLAKNKDHYHYWPPSVKVKVMAKTLAPSIH